MRRRNTSAWPVARMVPITDATTTASTGRCQAWPASRNRSVTAGCAWRNASGRCPISWPIWRRKHSANTPMPSAAAILAMVDTSAARLVPSTAITRLSVVLSPSAASAPMANSSDGERASSCRTASCRCALRNSTKMTWHTAAAIAPATIACATSTPATLAGDWSRVR
ncbi:hypothetical protein D3C72_1671780 [compost metagenome]